MTSQFISAAELMAKVLGLPGYPFVVIEHPISSATVEELAAKARAAADDVAAQLLSADRPSN